MQPDAPQGLSEQKQTLKQAVFCPKEGQPQLNLDAGEWIFPLLPEPPQLYVHLTPYEDWEMKRFYDSVIPHKRQRSQQESVIEVDTTGVKDFIDAHFLRLSNVQMEDGTDPTPEQQRLWLNEHADLKVRVFRTCLDRFEPQAQAESAPKNSKPTLLFGQQESFVNTEMRLYCRERDSVELVKTKHVLAKMTESDRHQYERSVSFIENSNRRETRTEANWDVILGIYNRLVKRVEGALLEDKPCDQATREQWVKRVPFCMKIYVMASAFSELDLKNA